MPVLHRLGALVARRRGRVLLAGLLAALALAGVAAGAMGSMVLSRWEAPGSESVRVQQLLADGFASGNANLLLLVTAGTGTVDAPAVRAAGRALEAELLAEAAVIDTWSYWSLAEDPTMRSADGRQAVVLAHVAGDATLARAAIREHLLPTYTRTDSVIDVRVGGGEAVSAQVSAQATTDFVRAELVVVPVLFLLLVALFRRVRAALLTLGVGLFAVVGALAGLRALTAVAEVSTFAANITLVMGVGLGVDYSLFVIARFREELTAGRPVSDAVARTVATAGRTVVFSGLTVAASLSALVLFPFPFLQSFGYAGVLVVAVAVVGALVLLPAGLAVLGPQALPRRALPRRWTGRGEGRPGAWYRIGALVVRRPVPLAAAALAVIAVLAAPAVGLRIGLPDDRVLPETASTRQTYDDLRAGFATEANDAVHLVAPGGSAVPADAVRAYAARLSRTPGVAQVNSSQGVYVDGLRVRPAPDPGRLLGTTGTRLEAVPTREVLSGTGTGAFVEQVRAVPAPFPEVLVGGYPAELADFRAALGERVPLVAGLVLAITFGLLLWMSGSVLVPVKATALNLLSLAVMFGVLVAVFQDGAFADVLGFTPIGTLDPAFPILMFCVAYGLSMDYEVYMLSRIRERYDATGDNTRAVLEGLQRSGPLITAAAAVLAVSFSIYAGGGVSYLKMIGIGVAVAVLVDATLIRAVLVPALMRLAGDANWWAPQPLRRLHQRWDPHRGDAGAPAPAPARG